MKQVVLTVVSTIEIDDSVEPRMNLIQYYEDEGLGRDLVEAYSDTDVWQEILYLIGVDDWPFDGYRTISQEAHL